VIDKQKGLSKAESRRVKRKRERAVSSSVAQKKKIEISSTVNSDLEQNKFVSIKKEQQIH
jgi:hypothetical protein